MKFKYLGTGASEGCPAVFCNCEYCNMARKLKGKNIRTRSQVLINEDLLVDFGEDTYLHALQFDLRLDKVKTLLITHSHSDHFVPQELEVRGSSYARNMESPHLEMYGNEAVIMRYFGVNGGIIEEPVEKFIHIHRAECFKPFVSNGYKITPLPARHMQTEQALIYIIEKDGKCILYGNDTGYPYDSVFNYIRDNKIRFDMISLDCTMFLSEMPIEAGHMDLKLCVKTKEKLEEIGAVDNMTIKYITHFTHNQNPMQDRIEKYAKPYGFKVAFDGEEIEF